MTEEKIGSDWFGGAYKKCQRILFIVEKTYVYAKHYTQAEAEDERTPEVPIPGRSR